MCERNRPDVLVCSCVFLSFCFEVEFGVLAAVIFVDSWTGPGGSEWYVD
jgi:hypothetical protein